MEVQRGNGGTVDFVIATIRLGSALETKRFQVNAMAKKRNSLVENINRRKRAGKSRPKKKSTVSKDAYRDMQEGWPRSGKKKTRKKSNKKRKRATRKTPARKRTSAKKAKTR
jgi:hypothetical protein